MTRLSLALVLAALAAGLASLPTAHAGPDGIAVIGPTIGGEGAWSSARMGGARERLKDILPGSR
jgi:hypothetical protein